MMVKICGLRDRANMELQKVSAPDFIGLIFYPGSPRFVDDDPEFRRYIGELEWAKKVGVFVNASPSEVCRTAAQYRLDFVQLHGQETPADCRVISAEVKTVKTIAVGEAIDFNAIDRYRRDCAYLLLDTASPFYGGTGRPFDWSLLDDSRLEHPFFLSGGIGPGDARRIRQLGCPGLVGIDLNSRFENRPGIKNENLIQKFIHELRQQ